MVECNDSKCPIHGSISIRGNTFTGIVVSTKPAKTAIVKRRIVSYVPKYERYAKSKSKIYAHSPDCIGAKENDIVRVGETRRLSKTKSFVVMEVLGKKKIVKAEEDTFREKRRVKEKEEETEEKKGREEAKEEKEEKKGQQEEKEEGKEAKGEGEEKEVEKGQEEEKEAEEKKEEEVEKEAKEEAGEKKEKKEGKD